MSNTTIPQLSSLTPAQQAKLPEYVEEFTAIGLATHTTWDKQGLEEAFRDAYKVAGLAPPTKFDYVHSPLEGVRVSGDTNISHAIYGNHDVSWLAFYNFLDRELGHTECAKVIPLIEICKRAGWYWPMEGRVVVSPRPSKLVLNSQGQPHNVNGKAIEYEDGFGVYLINGNRVSDKKVQSLIEAPSLTQADLEGMRGNISEEQMKALLPKTSTFISAVMNGVKKERGQK